MKVFLTGASGYLGGTIAVALRDAGHSVRGLVRDAAKAEQLAKMGVEPVRGDLDDASLLTREARAADATLNVASSDHRPSADALVEALAGSGKLLVHTSGSSIVSDGADGEPSELVYTEDTLPEPDADKIARVSLDRAVLAGNQRGLRAIVFCPTMVYGHGRGIARDSVQVPRIVALATKSGSARFIGRGLNRWSNVHVDDVAALYLRALDAPALGGFHFVENGEEALGDVARAIGERLGMPAESISIDGAIEEWGAEMARHGLGSNSRVRAARAREAFGWTPVHGSIARWIATEL